MNLLNKLAIKNLKMNIKRTVSTIIGIILSCSLICAVASMATSIQETLIQNSVNESGYYHINLLNIADDDIEVLKNNRDVHNIYTVNKVGYSFLENSKNEYKPYCMIFSMSKDSFNNLKFNIIDGHFPTNENEIIISEHIISNAGVPLKIGDKLNLSIGDRVNLDNDAISPDAEYEKNSEQLINNKSYEFTIVGIMERPNYNFETYSDAGYTVITTNMDAGIKNAYVSLKHPKEYKTFLCNFFGVNNFNEIIEHSDAIKYDYKLNDELLRWEAFAFGDDTVTMLYAVISIVIFIIIFTSIFCIRNSFAIATTEKMKMYGMLSSVGATKKQIRKNVLFESFILGLIGIPLGILAGIFAVFVLIKIVNSIGGHYLLNHTDGIIAKVTLFPILISILLSCITIYLSAISSAKKASKINPIDLLKNSENIKINSKKLKTPKWVCKFFKTGGELAYKNLKRSKKKYKTTVISLSVSICVFISMNSFITNAFDLANNYYEDYDYNIKISSDSEENNYIKSITQLNYIDEHFELYQNSYNLNIYDLSKITSENFLDSDDYYYDENSDKLIPSTEPKHSSLKIFALDDNSFKKYAKKIGVDYNKIKNDGILCDTYVTYSDDGDKILKSRMYNYSKGDIIDGTINGKETNFKIATITDICPYGLENTHLIGGILVLNLDKYKNMDFSPRYLLIQSSNPEKLIDNIKNLKINVGYSNYDELAKEEKAIYTIIQIFLYGFIIVITLIGVTNIFNTITSNIELRQKEFAVLRSIGMTKKEFNGMINLETIFYCSKSLIYGIFLGLIGTFALYKAFGIKIEKDIYIPIIPILVCIIAVFILVFIIMKYSISKINKQNTIETIRNENI